MRLVSAAATAIMLGCTISNNLHAQSKCDAIRPSSTSGLTLSITKTLVQKEVTVQFLISNTTNGRVYLKSAQWGDIAKSVLRSGVQLYNPTTSGMETTQGFLAATCASNTQCSQDLNTFSYIEPRDNMPFSFHYNPASPVHEDDAISFSVSMLGRFSKATDTTDQAGPPRALRFNFNSVPLGC